MKVWLGLLVGVLLLAGCTSDAKPKPSDLVDQPTSSTGFAGFGLVPPQPRPTFTLTDTTGRPYNFGTQTAGRPTLLYFGYTQCPDVCPTTMLDVRNALLAVPAPLRATVRVVFVTTDVKNDTAPVIATWLGKFDPGLPNPFVGLYGNQAQVDTAQAVAHVQLAEDDGKQHAANVLLYGADDYARVQYLQNTNEADQIAHDLPLVSK